MKRVEAIKREIICWGRLLFQRRLVTAGSGNISRRLDASRIAINSHDACLGFLTKNEILILDLDGKVIQGKGTPSVETPLHLDIYRNIEVDSVIHAHPPLTAALFCIQQRLELVSFESKLYLENLPVIPQQTPTVVDTLPVVEALKRSSLVILKGHGVVAIGSQLKGAFRSIDLLEEQAKINLIIKGYKGFE